MTDLIPVRAVETIDPAKPIHLTPAQAGGPIHTRSFTGRFRNLRLLGAGLLFLLFFGTAWIDWNGRQAVLWDLENRQFHIFGATFWPQDFILLSAILIIAAFGLFFITVLAGRVWCGYACPQSVWTWIFMRVEQITEGDRGQRIKLDAAPWSLQKLARRSAKHGLWLAVSVITAMAFVGYFTPVRQLTSDLLTLEMGATTAFWVLSFTAATYINAGWLREKVCRDMCPYSRFQSVMFDSDTLVISYDAARGENRGPRRKDADYKAEGLGDCIDCTMCVQVCPTGIDIRDGLQIECIGCAACIDACDAIMDKMNYPRGLISYTTEHNLSGQKTHLLRPRLIGYAIALLAMMSLFSFALYSRPLVKLDVLKDRVLYRENEMGQIENVYTLKVMNKAQKPQTFVIEARGLDGLTYSGRSEVQAAAGELVTVPVELSIAPEKLPSSTNEISFHVKSADDPSVNDDADSRFIGPSIR